MLGYEAAPLGQTSLRGTPKLYEGSHFRHTPELGPQKIPTGFRPTAQGREERATLGEYLKRILNPERVAPQAQRRADAS